MSLPYENTQTGDRALGEIQKALSAFGCNKFGSMIDTDAGELLVQFEYRGRKVSVRASAKGYAAAWMREHPRRPQMRLSQQQYEERAIEKGSMAIYSILRDWIKGQVTAVESGILSFEGAFLGSMLLENGKTVLEHMVTSNLLAPPK